MMIHQHELPLPKNIEKIPPFIGVVVPYILWSEERKGYKAVRNASLALFSGTVA
jgi:hypothetical protein